MTGEQIAQIIVAFLGGGGLVAVLTYLYNRKRLTVAECQTNIETALKLRDMAIREYTTAEEKLAKARELLDEVQTDLDNAKKYIGVLQDVLDENEIEYPTMDEIIKKGGNNG